MQFVTLLGFSNAISSYEYLQSGERDGIKGWKQFVHVPDLTLPLNVPLAEQPRQRSAKPCRMVQLHYGTPIFSSISVERYTPVFQTGIQGAIP